MSFLALMGRRVIRHSRGFDETVRHRSLAVLLPDPGQFKFWFGHNFSLKKLNIKESFSRYSNIMSVTNDLNISYITAI